MNYIFEGEDTRTADYYLQDAIAREKPEAILRFNIDEQGWQPLLDEMAMIGLFSQKEVLAARISSITQKDFPIEQLVSLQSEDKSLVLMVETPARFDKMYSAKKDAKKKELLRSFTDTAFIRDCSFLKDKEMSQTLKKLASEYHLSIDKDGMKWLESHGPQSLGELNAEFDKMSLYSGKLSLEDVKALVPARMDEDVFEMSNALFEKDGLKLMRLYRNFRAQNMEPLAILALLAGQIRFVFQVRVLMDQHMPQDAIAKELHESPGRIWYTMKKASRFSAMELLENLGKLSELDLKMKSGQVDKDTGFESWILSLMEEQFS